MTTNCPICQLTQRIAALEEQVSAIEARPVLGAMPSHANGHAIVPRALSEREHLILAALLEGLSNKAIARRLGSAEGTIKVHIKSLMRKLGVRNRTQAAMWASWSASHEQAAGQNRCVRHLLCSAHRSRTHVWASWKRYTVGRYSQPHTQMGCGDLNIAVATADANADALAIATAIASACAFAYAIASASAAAIATAAAYASAIAFAIANATAFADASATATAFASAFADATATATATAFASATACVFANAAGRPHFQEKVWAATLISPHFKECVS